MKPKQNKIRINPDALKFNHERPTDIYYQGKSPPEKARGPDLKNRSIFK
jgi:hypothetical protein